MTVNLTLKARRPRRLSWVLIAALFLTALATRTYRLSSFPSFPREFPWLGDEAGLYRDEAGYFKKAEALFEEPTVYQPWLHLALINVSARLFDNCVVAARLPSAVFSALTAVVIYLFVKRRFDEASALVSSLYFIAMAPALIYGRMAFLENSVAFFFTSTIYAVERFNEGGGRRWLAATWVLALAAAFSKVTGVIAPLFLMVYFLGRGGLRKALIFLPLLFVFPLSALFILQAKGYGVLEGLRLLASQWRVGRVGMEMSAWQYLFLSSMPSGYAPPLPHGYLRLEYWYLFAYLCLGYLLVKEPRKAFDVFTAMALFITMCVAVWGLGSYYLVVVQPLLAISVGPGVFRLLGADLAVTSFFTLTLYMPLAATLATYSCQVGLQGPNYALTLVKLGVLALPMVAALMLYLIGGGERRVLFNTIIVVAFTALLLIGSYVVNVLYPLYFTPRLG